MKRKKNVVQMLEREAVLKVSESRLRSEATGLMLIPELIDDMESR